MVDQLGQRKMNRDKALSSTYTSVLKIHAKVIGISPHGLIGPAEKNVAKKKKKKMGKATKANPNVLEA